MNDSMNALVTKFAECTRKRDETKDVNEANRYTRMTVKAFEDLVDRFGDEGRDALAVLLEDPDPSIRVLTAAFLLRYRHDDAVAVLRELEAGQGLPAFAARCSLMNRERGLWELDP